MTIELTSTDCRSIAILADLAAKYLAMKADALVETKTADPGELEAIRRLVGIAHDFEQKFDRLHLTSRIVERVATGQPLHT